MALSFAHGAIQWLAADAATTVYTVSGLSFQPKALRFYWVGLQNAADAVSETVNMHRGVGFAVDTSNRRCVGSFSQDTAATSNCGTVARNDAVACTTDGAGASDGELDLNSITSDGFTLIVDDAAPQNITIFWEAWGGADITVAVVGDIAEPAATGDQDYTVTGFVAGAVDQVVMLAGVQSTAAVNTASAGDSGFCVGFASGTGAQNIVLIGNGDDASTAMDTDGYARGDECLGMIVVAGGTAVDARAALTQFGTDNFRLNWAARAVTSRRSIFLAIKGGAWRVGDYTINGNTGSATATVSGLPFQPKGISLIGRMAAESTSNSAAVDDRMGFGSGDSTSSRRSMGVLDENATASSVCEIDTTIQYDQVLSFPSTAGALLSAYDINAINADGFQIIVDTAGGVASEWQGYLAFGDQLLLAAPSETLHISDLVLLPPLTATPSETLHLTDIGGGTIQVLGRIRSIDYLLTVTLPPLQVPSLAETLHISDSVVNARLGPLGVVASETLHISDTVTVVENPLLAVLSETLHISETPTVYLAPLFVSLSETLHITDVVTPLMGGLSAGTLTETLHISDSVTPVLTLGDVVLSETLHISDAVTPLMTLGAVTLSETLHIADTIVNRSLSGDLSTTLAETLHIAAAGEILVLGRIRSIDTIVDRNLQTVGGGDLSIGTLTETLHVADATGESWVGLEDTETLHITDTIAVLMTLGPVVLAETLHVSDVVTAFENPLVTSLSETLHISDVVTATTGALVTSLTETLHVSDTVTVSLTPLLGTLSETLHISDTVSAFETPLVVGLSETLHITDVIVDIALASAGGNLSKSLTEDLHISDTVAAFENPLFTILAEALHISDSVTPVMTLGDVTRTETLHITDVVTPLMTLGDVALTETLHIADTLVRVELRPLFVTLAETLHIADVVTVTMGDLATNAVAETLHISDTVTARMTLGDVSLSETLHVADSAAVVGLNPLVAVLNETLHVSDDLTIYVAGTLVVVVSETLHIRDTLYPERPPIIVGIGIYAPVIRGIGIYTEDF